MTPRPPIAEKIPQVTEIHGQRLVDDYFWLRKKEDPKVITYLKAENKYTEALTHHTEALQKSLYDELLGRIKEDDSSVPYRRGDFFYYTRTEKGRAYRIYCRKLKSLDAPEEILLDANELATGHEYFRIGAFAVSPDHQLLAYSVDHSGAERYTMHFLNLATKKEYAETIPNTYYAVAWANDNRTFFYTTVDETTRPDKLIRHVLGTAAQQDEIVLHEKDKAYYLSARRTRSSAYILATLESAVTTEVHYLDANKPDGKFAVIHPRQQNMEYYVAHHGDRFLITTNEDAINFKLMEAPTRAPQKSNWKELIPHRPDVTIRSIAAFADHLVLQEREDGLQQITVRHLQQGSSHRVTFEDPAYVAWLEGNHEFQTNNLRFGYSSLVQPESIYDYDMSSKKRELKKEKEVIGYDRSKYRSERIHAKAKDGTEVPISLVYREGTKKDGSAPLFLNGYGAYGYAFEPHFNSNWVSLLDRGFFVAIAHIRGGGEKGRQWKEDGKFAKKMNTFTDFIACAEHLVQEKYTAPERLVILGRSAGGLLIGAVVNMAPQLFGVAIAGVPFVDVVNTMLDETIPLTVVEWEEWGNPNEKEAFQTLSRYSPYDNVTAQDYPDLLVLAGLNDPRVAYWEPAKWTAKLRVTKTDNNVLLLRTNMGAGHGGASGRYGRLEERAFEMAFMLDRLGLAE